MPPLSRGLIRARRLGLEYHPLTIHLASIKMEQPMAEVHKLRDRGSETEKITINLGYVDLGHIDLLVQEGFYSNRTDFIRTAIRNQLATHGEEVRKSIVRHTLELGLRHYTRADLEAVKASGEKLHIKVLGLATIASDVTPSLALATIESITVLGALHARSRARWPIASGDPRAKFSHSSRTQGHDRRFCKRHALGNEFDLGPEVRRSNARHTKRIVRRGAGFIRNAERGTGRTSSHSAQSHRPHG
jgi:Arc/MetJ-type ribon-helix-helix transcriptional regulator